MTCSGDPAAGTTGTATTDTVSRAQLLRFAQPDEAGADRDLDRSVPENELLTFAVARLRSEGVQVVDVTADGDFVVEGDDRRLDLVRRHLAVG